MRSTHSPVSSSRPPGATSRATAGLVRGLQKPRDRGFDSHRRLSVSLALSRVIVRGSFLTRTLTTTREVSTSWIWAQTPVLLLSGTGVVQTPASPMVDRTLLLEVTLRKGASYSWRVEAQSAQSERGKSPLEIRQFFICSRARGRDRRARRCRSGTPDRADARRPDTPARGSGDPGSRPDTRRARG